VWENEARDWSHTRHLTFSYVLGDAEARIRALFRPADIYIINYENLQWLTTQLKHYWLTRGQYPPFNRIVWDEITSMKNTSSKRVNAILQVLPYVKYRIGLTGTPASNGLVDMHGQYLVVDSGARLGISQPLFKQRFFKQEGYRYVALPDTSDEIAACVGDITLEMRDTDYIDMPEVVVNDIWIDLPPKAREIYDQVETEFFAELDSGAPILIYNEASKSNKCLQIAAGAAYLVPGEPQYEVIHTAKLEAWQAVRNEIGDNPLLSSYVFKFTGWELQKQCPRMVNLSERKDSEIDDTVKDFNAGKILDMIGHPASIGHGLNLQKICYHIAMVSVTWSLDKYLQFIARVARQGQKQSHVILHRILARDTLDEVVLARLRDNADTQEGIRNAVQEYRAKRGL
jgi:hypothetical protein